MIKRRLIPLFIPCLLTLASAAGSVEQIRFNPFGYTESDKSQIAERDSPGKTAVQSKPVVRSWKPLLLATIVAG